MRRICLAVLVLGAVVLMIDVLGDLTQDRPDRDTPGARSEILLEVRTRGYPGSPAEAATNLWAACQGSVTQRLVDPGVVAVGANRFRLVTDRALGEHSWRRLQGCLEDAIIDRVSAEVVAKRDLAPSAG